MLIENAKYIRQVTGAMDGELCAINCVINGINYSVPLREDSQQYVEIMKQVDAGELTIEPADEPTDE